MRKSSNLNSADRANKVSKIVSGITFCEFSGQKYILHPPDSQNKYFAEKIYQEKVDEALEIGISSEEDFVKQLILSKLWSEIEQEHLDSLPKLIEESKIQLYYAYKNFKSREIVNKNLKKHKNSMEELTSKKNLLRRESAEGMAEMYKHKYLACAKTTDAHGNALWGSEGYFIQDGNLINSLFGEYLNNTCSEDVVRELCRNDPWVSLWTAGKNENGVFGKPSSELTDEQRIIISWSRVYDSIQESPESPPDEVIENCDMLDGWLILQGRKREKEKQQKQNSGRADKMKGDEVYMFADNESEAQRIFQMNDSDSKAILRNRQKQIEKSKKGVPVDKTLDAQLELHKQAVEKFKGHVRQS